MMKKMATEIQLNEEIYIIEMFSHWRTNQATHMRGFSYPTFNTVNWYVWMAVQKSTSNISLFISNVYVVSALGLETRMLSARSTFVGGNCISKCGKNVCNIFGSSSSREKIVLVCWMIVNSFYFTISIPFAKSIRFVLYSFFSLSFFLHSVLCCV